MNNINISNNWIDYELINSGDGMKQEKWGKYILKRPDPQAIWPNLGWDKSNSIYHRSDKGGGYWEKVSKIPNKWTIGYKNLKFYIEPTGFKHTGLFPEQAYNWDFMMDKIKSAKKEIKVLNLFAYTGGATLACASAGASVCHVDAAKRMVGRAKENLELSKLGNKPVRFIVDDVFKFVNREIRRNNKYDAIIMDPPNYGRGPSGEKWQLEEELYNLVDLCTNVLSDNPLFFIINSYASSITPTSLNNILSQTVAKKFPGNIYCYELGLKQKNSDLVLPCGCSGRFEK